jgi:hypothetical protein
LCYVNKLILKKIQIFEINKPSNSLTIQDICIYSQFQFGGPIVGRGSFAQIAPSPPLIPVSTIALAFLAIILPFLLTPDLIIMVRL